MRIQTEAVVRGEVMELELSEQDFCPECCGTLEVAGTGERRHLQCASCYAVFRPKQPDDGRDG
jgi:protein-arginine kinase activator protein McsA